MLLHPAPLLINCLSSVVLQEQEKTQAGSFSLTLSHLTWPLSASADGARGKAADCPQGVALGTDSLIQIVSIAFSFPGPRCAK